MTSKKQLKDRIRTRMATTGERYLTARRHVAGEPEHLTGQAGQAEPTVDNGYTLRGGTHPESASVANVLAHHGVRVAGAPLSEAMVFGAGGGIGAGYILWEFASHQAGCLVLGYRNRWQYPADWLTSTLELLGVPAVVHRTAGAKGAAAALTRTLAEGHPAIILPDRYLLGYWHLPAYLEARGGDALVAYAESAGRVHLDDRNLRPLTVARPELDDARARVVSYKNLLVDPRPGRDLEIPAAVLRAAVLDGLRSCAERLTSTSDSFGLPAWRKWSRLMTDARQAKGWPKVFADGRGLTGALMSIWEGVEPAGASGGNLRLLYADFLVEAAAVLDAPALAELAPSVVAAADAWHRVAEAAAPATMAPFDELRELTATVSAGLAADGDAGSAQVAEASARLWKIRADHDAKPGPAEVFAPVAEAVAEAVAEVYQLETAFAQRLSEVVLTLRRP